MTRVKRGVQSHRRHKTILERTKGHRGQRHRLIKRAHESMLHALRYNYVDRKDRKSDFRELWIMRINAAARLNGLTYSRMIHGLALAGIDLDRKALADIAVTRPDVFTDICDTVKGAIAKGGSVSPRVIAPGTNLTITAGTGEPAPARAAAVAVPVAEAAPAAEAAAPAIQGFAAVPAANADATVAKDDDTDAKLRAANAGTPASILERAGTAVGRKALAEETGISASDLLELVNRADLMRINGVGPKYADLLENAGVDTVKELGTRNAANLHAKLTEVNATENFVDRLPTAEEVEAWVAEAKTLDQAVFH